MHEKIRGRIVSIAIVMLILRMIVFVAEENIYAGSGINQNEEERYPVRITFYNLENGTKESFRNMELTFWKGAFSYEEALHLTAQTQREGQIRTKMPKGVYTMQTGLYYNFGKSGPGVAYQKFEVTKEGAELQGYLIPVIPEGQSLVLLLWEEEDIDLDLIVNLKNQEEWSDTTYIGGRICVDEHGNRIVKCSSSGCEAAFINTAIDGNYQIYINDYTNTLAGNYDADTLHDLNACVYIYDSQGLVQAYEVPDGENGVVWEVAQISGSQVAASQKVYSKAEGQNWWVENTSRKQLANTVTYSSNRIVQTYFGMYEYSYDSWGNLVKSVRYNKDGSIGSRDEYSYDRKGNRTKLLHYDHDGGLSMWEKYDYDSQGHLIRDTLYNGMSDSIIYWRQDYDYDQYGNETRNVIYWGNGQIKEGWEKTYDIFGNKIREITYKDDAVANWYEYKYDARGNQVKKARYNENGSILFDWIEYSYDNEGNQTKNVGYNCDGTIDSGWEKSYGDYGNVIKYINYRDDTIDHWVEYSYDSQGNMTKATFYGGDGNLSGWNEYGYDREGNICRDVSCNSDGTIDSGWEKSYDSYGNEWYISYSDNKIAHWVEYNYDSQGNMIKEVHYEDDKSLSEWTEYSYDSQGNSIKACSYDKNDNIMYWYEFGYDSRGSLTKSTRYLNDGMIDSGWERSYDRNGNEIKYISYNSDNINVWKEYSYDEEGNKTKEITRNSDGSIDSGFEECYDREGNKIRYISYENGNIDSQTEYFYK